MKHLTSELSGALLDQAVAKALGWRENKSLRQWETLVDGDWFRVAGAHFGGWSPSTLWGDGGPLIQKYHISVECFQDTAGASNMRDVWWCATAYGGTAAGLPQDGCGEAFDQDATPLIAAMRALVSAKLGDEVELP